MEEGKRQLGKFNPDYSMRRISFGIELRRPFEKPKERSLDLVGFLAGRPSHNLLEKQGESSHDEDLSCPQWLAKQVPIFHCSDFLLW
ncbi:hypothetical protein AMTR_s04308p00005590 [Amborella trichopoda]|uniref:Uncharacterized protein n=1 Tax=Amborella trichopoda TaxID=13333 RepID=U5CL30_AMBTC|nr:hypothetical protein AMTR_s04308p00005590 [Amborella trichopoda]